MKIDFEVIEPNLGKNLHEFNFCKGVPKKEKRKITWGQEAFVIAQVEIAKFNAFPDFPMNEDTEVPHVRTVIGRINGQTYACLLVLCDGGIDTGHPMLIKKA